MRSLSLFLTTITIGNCLPKPLYQAGQILTLASILLWLLGVRYTPGDRVGLVQKIRVPSTPLMDKTTTAATERTAFQGEVLRAGFHIGLWPWQYRIHRVPLVTVPRGTVGYVYSRANKNRDQDAPQAILTEGSYAIHLAEFFVLTRDKIYSVWLKDDDVGALSKLWQHRIEEVGGFQRELSSRRNIGQVPCNPSGFVPLREERANESPLTWSPCCSPPAGEWMWAPFDPLGGQLILQPAGCG